MTVQHQQLAAGKWLAMSFFEQMANVGSEVERTILWKNKNTEYSQKALERALELLDLTINDRRNVKRLPELVRVRELLADTFFGDNQFSSSDKSWSSYFYPFNYAARLNY